MSQEVIGKYLDSNFGKYFTSSEIIKVFEKQYTRGTILMNLRKLCKRQEYEVVFVNKIYKHTAKDGMVHNGQSRQIALYGAKEEQNGRRKN